jgi:hypothetical protein
MVTQVQDSKQSKTLQAYIARRDHLWVRVRADHPTYTHAQIEARLEQFGA